MEILDWILDKIFWAFVGAAGFGIWLKASYTCTILGVCVKHQFDFMSAFGS